MTITRDFLDAPRPTPSVNLSLLERNAQMQLEALKDIRKLLYKMNPNVLTMTMIQGALNNVIIDTKAHDVTFQVGGKAVPIYKLVAYSSYTNVVSLSLTSMQSGAKDGILFDANNRRPVVLPIEIDNASILIDVVAGAGCPVNGPVLDTNGGFYLWGFAIPDVIAPDWE